MLRIIFAAVAGGAMSVMLAMPVHAAPDGAYANYCGASPRPGACTGPATAVPIWDAATGTLIGNGLDTVGASGWFQPTVAISAPTFTFSRQIGLPAFQLWLASHAVPVTAVIPGTNPDAGVSLILNDIEDEPIVSDLGDPVTATPDENGIVTFPAVFEGDYNM